jgi:transposase
MSYLVRQPTKSGKTYIYQTEATWDSTRRRSVQSRLYLGRLDPHTGRLIPGKKRGEDLSVNGSVAWEDVEKTVASGGDVHRQLAEMASRHRDQPPVAPPTSGRIVEYVTEPGCFHLARELAAATGLQDALASAFGKRMARQLLFLASYQMLEATPLYLARSWMEKTFGEPILKGLEFEGDGLLLERIGADCPLRMEFFRNWIARRKNPKALVYDITSISTYSEILDLAEYGYNRDGENIPQINLASVHDRLDRLPLFYRVLGGSISDVSTLKLTGELTRDLGLKDFHFVLDRGFCSQANMAEMMRNRIGFTMAIPHTSKQAKAFIKERRLRLGRVKHAFAWNGKPMYHMQGEWTVELGVKKKATCSAHLFLNPQRQADEEERFLARILRVEELASKIVFAKTAEAYAWMDANAHGLKSYFTVRRNPEREIFIQRRNHAIAVRCGNMGMNLIIVTDLSMARDDVLSEYRSRDSIEKAYDILKNENGQDRLHISTRAQAEGRIFLAFLALILACELDQRMRKADLYKLFTVSEVFAELAKIRALHMTGGTTRILELSKKQRTLLEQLNVPATPENIVIK